MEARGREREIQQIQETERATERVSDRLTVLLQSWLIGCLRRERSGERGLPAVPFLFWLACCLLANHRSQPVSVTRLRR